MAEQTDPGWYSSEAATFGDRLEGARAAAGMNRAQFATRLGVKLRTVQAWEEDQAEPRANRLQMMAGMLNVSLRWLLTGEGDGLSAPSELPTAAKAALDELSRVRAQMQALSVETAQLETRLREIMKVTGND